MANREYFNELYNKYKPQADYIYCTIKPINNIVNKYNRSQDIFSPFSNTFIVNGKKYFTDLNYSGMIKYEQIPYYKGIERCKYQHKEGQIACIHCENLKLIRVELEFKPLYRRHEVHRKESIETMIKFLKTVGGEDLVFSVVYGENVEQIDPIEHIVRLHDEIDKAFCDTLVLIPEKEDDLRMEGVMYCEMHEEMKKDCDKLIKYNANIPRDKIVKIRMELLHLKVRLNNFKTRICSVLKN